MIVFGNFNHFLKVLSVILALTKQRGIFFLFVSLSKFGQISDSKKIARSGCQKLRKFLQNFWPHVTPTASFFIYLATNDLFFSAYPFLTTLFVPRGTSIWFHSSIVCEKHAVCSRSLCPRARSIANRSNLATLGGSTRSGHGPRGGFLTSLNVCLRQLTGETS